MVKLLGMSHKILAKQSGIFSNLLFSFLLKAFFLLVMLLEHMVHIK